jgi:hypothetical protein
MKGALQVFGYFIGIVVFSVRLTEACTPTGDTSFEFVDYAMCIGPDNADCDDNWCQYSDCGWAIPCVGQDAQCNPGPSVLTCDMYPGCGTNTEC